MYKIAILTSHPIQYQTPLFKKISEHLDINLTVYFREKKGVTAPYYDQEFGREVQWEIPLLEGYSHTFLSGFQALSKELRAGSYDALILYGWNSWMNMIAFIVCRLRKIKIFMYGENPLHQELKKHNPLQKIKRIMLRFLFKSVSAFLFIGEENRRFYKFLGVPERKLFNMPYAVDNERWGNERKSAKHKNPEHKPTILFVGKLIPRKRPLDLIRAFAPLDTEGELIMVGEGSLRKELESYVRNHSIKNVRFMSFVNQGALSEYYDEADIFVLPSGAGETWGLVVNEAMNFSLPVIVSDAVGCATDLVRQGTNGFVYPEGDVKKLSECIRALIKNKNMRTSFGQKSGNLIQHFSYEKDVEGIISALSSC
ncbi:MAG: glycosyltransferase family 4 protein [bacterium]|nr:glycosyltransferase family 4 protein [bacterium]